MNKRPDAHSIKKSENGGLALERCSFRSLGVAAGLILALGITGLTLSGCSGSDSGDVATTTGGTATTTTSSTAPATTSSNTYTFGENNSDRVGHSESTGISTGGGQQGPVGQTMTVTNVESVPLRQDQLPTQQQGEILGVTDLGVTYTQAPTTGPVSNK